jgi:F0F1-type ATP synthase delta subunit
LTQYVEEGLDYHLELLKNENFDEFCDGYNQREQFANDFSINICKNILSESKFNFIKNHFAQLTPKHFLRNVWENFQKHKAEIKDVDDLNKLLGISV